MSDEYDVMVRNDTWSLVDRQLEDNVVNCIWLFKVKERTDGTVDLLKAHLVANGMNQIKGLDYQEAFSPIIKPISIRIVLSLVVTNGWTLHQINIWNAFLNGVLDKRILMKQPLGFVDDN